MRPVADLFAGRPSRPWVLAGKGPSFASFEDRGEYPVFGLNHVCRFVTCAAAHFTDLDAYLQCQDVLAEGTGGVVLPLYPHVRNRPGKRELSVLIATHPSLARLDAAGRLFTYNSSLSRLRRKGYATHTVRFFSAVVGLHILAANGIRDVITVGIDGGTGYAPCFSTATLLSNGRSSFDVQSSELKRIAEKFGVTVTPTVIRAKE